MPDLIMEQVWLEQPAPVVVAVVVIQRAGVELEGLAW